jgi:predicted RNA binding protein YcfA (HicA-like mRNA interferase family)
MSQRLPALKPKDVLRALEKAGFHVHQISGSHYLLKHPDKPPLRVTPPWHNRDLKRGTLASILAQVGLTGAELAELL